MSEQVKKQTANQYTAEQYLMTAFSRADWISAEYKQISSACKDNPLAFRELYLCACDRVPIEAVRIAVSNEPMEENLKTIRSKHFEKMYTDMQNFFMNELTETVESLRKEVDTVSNAAKYFAETIPSLEEMFANEPHSGQSGKQMADFEPENRNQKADKDIVPNFGTNAEPKSKDMVVKPDVKGDEKTTASKWKSTIASLFERKRKPTDFLNELYEKDYNDEQIGFIIGCIEEGLSEKEIRTFISPKFDIATMKRLRKIYVKE